VGVQDRTAIPTPARPGCDDPSSPRCFDDWKHVGLAGWVTCATRENDSMYCWGSNAYGARGDGSPADFNNETPEPQPVAGNIRWSSVEGGKRHVCGLDLDDALYCWGSNEAGQRGVSNRENATTPQRVDAPVGWTALALGHLHTCAIRLDRTLWCWGSNAEGQVGINSTEEVIEHPTRVCF
jgi:alpha-tubulin suppressor-like RCC1 family protein